MSVSIVTGAQYGSEGKGKVALEWARRTGAAAAVRVGGPNSGHSVVVDGRLMVFRQLPTAAVLPGVLSVLPPGAYIDLDVLRAEMAAVDIDTARLVIDPRAIVITRADIDRETSSGIIGRIGSTGSGTGAAVERRVKRDGSSVRAGEIRELAPFLGDSLPLLREIAAQDRVIIEGTQGYGLSLMHGLEGDFATSRDTTAAGFLAETGLSPLDVDEVVLVARAFPIRVAGNSGSLANELSWDEVGRRSGRENLLERTTVTRRVRRVGDFEPEIVTRAIYANSPTHFVLNHVDYVARLNSAEGRDRVQRFLHDVEVSVSRAIDFIGLDAESIETRADFMTEAVGG